MTGSTKLRKTAFLFGAATFVTLLTTSQIYIAMLMDNRPMKWFGTLTSQALFWFGWAMLVPLVLWLGRRVRIEAPHVLRGIAAHVPLSILVGLIHIACTMPFRCVIVDHRVHDMLSCIATCGIVYSLHENLFIYWALLGASYAFEYYNRFREGDLRASGLEAQLANAKLEALRSQLQPHFLFNTLHGIAGLVRDNKNTAAVGMIAGLSELLRQALENSGKQEVPLAEELEFTRRYLAIQQMRFSDRLTTDIDAPNDVLSAMVPNLILQPLVENAVRHGISRSTAAGCVTIRARQDGPSLKLEVLDDGPGLNGGNGKSRSTGIGLTNTKARLTRLYGAGFEFDVRTRDEGGAAARVTIPLHFAPAGEYRSHVE